VSYINFPKSWRSRTMRWRREYHLLLLKHYIFPSIWSMHSSNDQTSDSCFNTSNTFHNNIPGHLATYKCMYREVALTTIWCSYT
jgi:hypothetical protein